MSECKYCHSGNLKQFEATERMLGLGGQFFYSECLNCGSLQLENIPDDLTPYYSGSDYYSFVPLVRSGSIINFLKTLRMRFFLSAKSDLFSPQYGYWLKKIHPAFTDSIADVGCGNGQLLYELYASGYKKLTGFDPFLKESKRLTENLNLIKGNLEESEANFDLIMMHHSFEHMEYPEKVLHTCYSKLNPGGKLLLRVPVADAAVWKEKGTSWVQLDAPRHLTIPTVSGFRKLAETAGFSLLEVEFDSNEFQFWGTLLYESNQKLNPKLIQEFIKPDRMNEYKEKALLYNQEGQGDQACFYLKKTT